MNPTVRHLVLCLCFGYCTGNFYYVIILTSVLFTLSCFETLLYSYLTETVFLYLDCLAPCFEMLNWEQRGFGLRNLTNSSGAVRLVCFSAGIHCSRLKNIVYSLTNSSRFSVCLKKKVKKCWQLIDQKQIPCDKTCLIWISRILLYYS